MRRRFGGAIAWPRPPRVFALSGSTISATPSAASRSLGRASSRYRHWMGHADVDTTMRYLHHKDRASDAQLLADAFEPSRGNARFAGQWRTPQWGQIAQCTVGSDT